MATFVLVHGAWGGGWEWRLVADWLQCRKHVVHRPTLTGLGERRHLARPEIDLETHIADVLAVLECEGLDDVVLVGQSYGGAVVTGVADRAADRITHLVYVDAFAPRDGESVNDLSPTAFVARLRQLAAETPGGWEVPVPFAPDELGLPAEVEDWYAAKLSSHPLASLEQPLRLTGAVDAVPKTYVNCAPPGASNWAFLRFADRARGEGWGFRELNVGHDAQIVAPDRLGQLLEDVGT
jgi:pimeloyl-ACP methyl ester carboxylesterase